MVGFMIWSVCALPIFIFGIICMTSKKQKQFGFWANAAKFEVKDVRAYNRALGKLFMGFAVGLELLGLPIFAGDDSPLILLTLVGTMILSIVSMVIYTVVIEPKYRKK